MQISELKAGQGKVDVEAVVKSKAEPRVFNKFGKELRVANAVVSDASGEISLSLWNDDIDKVQIGDTVRITNGYVSEFNGLKQLTSGKFGKLEIVGKESGSGQGKKPAQKPADDEVAF
ncbi:DNA-binding protein [Candidatus Pacearchaeota archaeon]|nr:DNA-binding protein [Candidatus Pacearchaeota archaeon]